MGITSKQKSAMEDIPSSGKKTPGIDKKEKAENPLDFFRGFIGKRIVVDEAKGRELEVESVRKNSGVKVSFINGEKLSEETLKTLEQLEQFRKLIIWATNRDKRENGGTMDQKKEESMSQKPERESSDDNVGHIKTEEVENVVVDIDEEIDPEKRRDGVKEIFEEKVNVAKTINELISIVYEIGSTKVDGEVVIPEIMEYRLESLGDFSSEELLEWKLEGVTEEFGIKNKAREIRLDEIEKAEHLLKSNIVESKKKDNLEKEARNIGEIKKDLDEAEEAYKTMLEKIKELKGFFKTSNISLEKSGPKFEAELQELEEAYKYRKNEYEEAVSREELKQAA